MEEYTFRQEDTIPFISASLIEFWITSFLFKEKY